MDPSALTAKEFPDKDFTFEEVTLGPHAGDDHVYVVSFSDHKVILRISDNPKRIQRNAHALEKLNPLDRAPKILLKETNYSFESFLPGRFPELRSLNAMHATFRALKDVHSIQRDTFGDFDENLSNWKEHFIDHRVKPLTKLFLQHCNEPKIIDYLIENTPHCETFSLLHGDVPCLNTLAEDQHIRFFDFDLSFYGDPYIDFGNMQYFLKFNQETLEKICEDMDLDLTRILYYALYVNVNKITQKSAQMIPDRVEQTKTLFEMIGSL